MINSFKYITLLLIGILFIGISHSQNVTYYDQSKLLSIISGKDNLVDEVIKNSLKYHLQINFTRIDEQGENIKFEDYSLNKDKYYFHPASLIKLPLAVASLELLTKYQNQFNIGLNNPVQSSTCACDLNTDKYVNNKLNPTLDILFREMLIMSNNDAYNFFYNFVGTNYFNSRMKDLSLENVILRNRFSSSCTVQSADKHGGIYFLKDTTGTKYKLNCSNDSNLTMNQSIYLGDLNSRNLNLASLYSIHKLMVQIFYPKAFNPNFNLLMSTENLNYFKNTISSYPKSISDYVNLPNTYHKYLIPSHLINNNDSSLKIYSKNGNAGGYISDVMFLKDDKSNIKYFLSVSMFNYQQKKYYRRRVYYTSPGIDFFRKLSKILYDYEKNKK